jgi:hypothetical protein
MIEHISGIKEVIHVIPVGIEYDRAIQPFKLVKADRVYLLANTKGSRELTEMRDEQRTFIEKIKEYLVSQSIYVDFIEVNLFDLPDTIKTISKIVLREKRKGNHININMSAAGRLTSVAATLVGMYHNVNVYYVHADEYSKDPADRELHGISICKQIDVIKLTNFKFQLPDKIGMHILIELSKVEHLKTKELLDLLKQQPEIEEFQNNVSSKNKHEIRKIMSRELMKLDKTHLNKLERGDYISRQKIGRDVIISITESGRYAAYISGELDD